MNRDGTLFLTRGGCVSCLRACFGARLLLVILYPNPSEGADRVAGQLRGDKECPFSGVTKSGRVWRRVPESDDRSVPCLVKYRVLLSGAADLQNVSLVEWREEFNVRTVVLYQVLQQ